MSYDPISESLELLGEVEMMLFGVCRPPLIEPRQRQMNEARNILRRFIKQLESVQRLRDSDMEKHRDIPWRDGIGTLKDAPTKDSMPSVMSVRFGPKEVQRFLTDESEANLSVCSIMAAGRSTEP